MDAFATGARARHAGVGRAFLPGFLFGQNHSLNSWRGFQTIDSIPKFRRGLKFHFLCGMQHVRMHGFKHFIAVHFFVIFAAGGGAHTSGSRQFLLNSAANCLVDSFWGDVVGDVVGDLFLAPP